MKYIVFWKSGEGQQVTTVVDANNEPVQRELEYVTANSIQLLERDDDVFEALSRADGEKYAVTADLARATLGWDL